MKAIVQDAYGSPDLLELREIDRPAVGDDAILVKVHAAAVNALDWHMTRGMPFVVRMAAGLDPRNRVIGVDLAGRVVTVGKNVTRFKAGDDVFGGADGSFAEYAVTKAERLALKPAAISYGQAASLHVAGLTALQGLRDKARVEAGQRVLINGAGGGVGTFAVQIAKWLGAQVTAVTRTESIALVRSLGADRVIDYRAEDFTRGSERYDVVFDIGGNRPFGEHRRVMAKRGTLVVVGGPPGRWVAPATRLLQALVLSPFVSQRLVPFVSANDREGLELLARLAEAGTIKAVIDRQFALADVPAAIRYVGEGHARGKVTIEIA